MGEGRQKSLNPAKKSKLFTRGQLLIARLGKLLSILCKRDVNIGGHKRGRFVSNN